MALGSGPYTVPSAPWGTSAPEVAPSHSASSPPRPSRPRTTRRSAAFWFSSSWFSSVPCSRSCPWPLVLGPFLIRRCWSFVLCPPADQGPWDQRTDQGLGRRQQIAVVLHAGLGVVLARHAVRPVVLGDPSADGVLVVEPHRQDGGAGNLG